jgi:hypothetical protein
MQHENCHNSRPDPFGDQKLIGDTKNVQYVPMTPQLQDYLAFAQQNNYAFQLTVDVNTVLSSSVINAVPIINKLPLP